MLIDCAMKKRVQRYQEHHRVVYLKFLSYPLPKKVESPFLSMSSPPLRELGQGANVSMESDVEDACFGSHLEGMSSGVLDRSCSAPNSDGSAKARPGERRKKQLQRKRHTGSHAKEGTPSGEGARWTSLMVSLRLSSSTFVFASLSVSACDIVD